MEYFKKWFSIDFFSILRSVFLFMLWIIGLSGLFLSIMVNIAPLVGTCSSFFASIGLKDTCYWLVHFLSYATWAPVKPFQQLSSLFLSTAVLIALLTYIREKKRSRSDFFLKRASNGLDEVYKLLEDQNNDRVIWIRAARTLLESRKLSKEIELKEYQRVYRLHEEQVRHNLYIALSIYDKNIGGRKSLEPHFFYGNTNWGKQVEDGMTLDEVAKEASPPMKTYRSDINRVLPIPTPGPLDRKSVCTIFDFLKYPENYEDPLADVKVWDAENWFLLHGRDPGAMQYLHHQKTRPIVGGKIIVREPPDNPSA